MWKCQLVVLGVFLSLYSTSKGLVTIVTGANGYIGRGVVQELHNHRDCSEVICLVRAHRVESELKFWSLRNQSNATPRIQVLPYDMLDGGSSVSRALETVAADENNICLIHVASVFAPTDDHKNTAMENIQGTEDLIQILSKSSRRCKLVLTSSMAAVRGPGQKPMNGASYTFEDWNTVSKLGASWESSYQWSKTQAERRAWEMCKESSIPLTVLNPSLVVGPALGESSSYSLALVEQWINGVSPVQSRLFVDVRDVAKAHVAAALRPITHGKRYIVSSEARIPSEGVASLLRDACRVYGLTNPESVMCDTEFNGGAIPVGEREVEATNRLREDMGLELRPMKETIIDMVKHLLDARQVD